MSAQARRWKRIRFEQKAAALVRHCLAGTGEGVGEVLTAAGHGLTQIKKTL
jgi:hypothetical protein